MQTSCQKACGKWGNANQALKQDFCEKSCFPPARGQVKEVLKLVLEKRGKENLSDFVIFLESEIVG